MATPRSYLYVPGDRPDFLDKATGRGADALIIDLEDAVPAAAKPEARRLVAAWLGRQQAGGSPELWVRINAGEVGVADIDAVGGSERLHGVCLAKTEVASDVEQVAARLDRLESRAWIMPLLESAQSVLEVRAIAQAPRVKVLQLGEADLAVDAGIDPGPMGDEFGWCRSLAVLASAAAGLAAPVAPASANFRDLDLLRTSTAQLRRLGFFGRACVHPAQTAVANEVFDVDPQALDDARELLERSAELGATTFVGPDGKMVDEAVLRSARRTLARG